MEQQDYWAAFAGSGSIQDYLQYVSHKKENRTAGAEERWHGTENQGTDYQGTNHTGE